MATFISLVSLTDQGMRNVKESPSRADAFRGMARDLGVTVRDIYWTVGHYDIVIILDGPDEAVASVLFSVASLGNVRTQTLRAFSAEEMGRIAAAMT